MSDNNSHQTDDLTMASVASLFDLPEDFKRKCIEEMQAEIEAFWSKVAGRQI